jgi:hypothetical protein
MASASWHAAIARASGLLAVMATILRPGSLAAAAVAALPANSFLIDGEAIVTNGDGLAVFDLIRRRRHGDSAVLIAFDLIELDGEDLRRSPIERASWQSWCAARIRASC